MKTLREDELNRREHGHLIFGEGETRWQFPDLNDEKWSEAAHAARYGEPTQTQRFYLAELADTMDFLLGDCLTTEGAVAKLRVIRREMRRKP